jgi:hypothetical protein
MNLELGFDDGTIPYSKFLIPNSAALAAAYGIEGMGI